MSKLSLRGAGLLAFSLLFAASAGAADGSPKPTDILFNTPHIAKLATGTVLDYKFERKPSDEKLLGLAFTDDIKVTIESDGAPGKKNVRIDMYSGERARDPQRITGMDGNPMLIVYLDTAVSHFRQLAGGDGSYLKGTFSRFLGSDATIEPVKITYKGQEVDGYRVKAVPYANDKARSKMNGYEDAEFTIAVSDKVPGYFAQMVSSFRSTDASAPYLIEKTTLDGVGGVK